MGREAWFPESNQVHELFVPAGWVFAPLSSRQGGYVYELNGKALFVFAWSNPRFADELGGTDCRLVINGATIYEDGRVLRTPSPWAFYVDFQPGQWDTHVVPAVKEWLAQHEIGGA